MDTSTTESNRKWYSKYRKFFTLTKEMIPCKLAYLFMDGAYGSTIPYLNLFLVSIGLTPAKAGLSNGIATGFSILAAPLWGMLIDITGHRKLIFVILGVGAASVGFSMPWAVQAVAKKDYNVTCHKPHPPIPHHNVSSEINGFPGPHCFPFHLLNEDTLFCVCMTIGIITAIFVSGLHSNLEGAVVNVVKTRKTKTSYGKQKVFSPIGFLLGGIAAGVASDHYKHLHMSSISAVFFVFLPCILLIIPLGYTVVSQGIWDQPQQKKANHNKKLLKGFLSVFNNHENIIFLLTVIVSGVSFNIYIGFLFLFLTAEMHPTKTAMSITMLPAVASELLVYPFSSKIIKTVGGPIPCIIVGIFSYFPRFMFTSFVENVWVMLPIQLFQGIGMSLSWAAQVEHAYTIFPKEVTITAISIIGSLHFIGSAAIANVAGGAVFHQYGGRVLYRGAAVIAGVWSLFLLCYYGIKKKIAKSNNKCIQPASSKEYVDNSYTQDIEIEGTRPGIPAV